MSSCIKVTDINISKFRIFVRVSIEGQKYSNEDLKNRLLDKVPSLAYHKCKNEDGQAFIDVMGNTSLAHMLEHLIIDFQVRFIKEAGISKKSIFGTTQWLDEDKGLAKIEVSYSDDIIALKSIKSAEKLLNESISK